MQAKTVGISIEVVLGGIQNGPKSEFDNFGSQKVDFHVLGKKVLFLWKMDHPLKLKI